MENKRVLIFALILFVLFGGYFAYSKFFKNERTISITDELIVNLKYPEVNTISHSNYARFEYKDFSIDNLDRDFMMLSAAVGLKGEEVGKETYLIDGNKIKNNYQNIFGPDTQYKDESLKLESCCAIQNYDSSNNKYEKTCGCGAVVPEFSYKTKLFKAIKSGDYIYTYFYVQPYVSDKKTTYLYKRPTSNFYRTVDESLDIEYFGYDKKINANNTETEIKTMMDKGLVDVYKFTFKKQSDNNYYIYSGAWERN